MGATEDAASRRPAPHSDMAVHCVRSSKLGLGMPAIPITLRCECGQTHTAELGDRLRCECGRSYDTRAVDQTRLAGVRQSQAKMRVYITCGTLFIIGVAAVTFALWGLKGIAIGIPASGLFWFRLIGPIVRRRVFFGAGELPTWQLEASQAEPEP